MPATGSSKNKSLLHPCNRVYTPKTCIHGDVCMFRHYPQDMCLDYAKGKCPGKNGCKYKDGSTHPSPKELKEMAIRNNPHFLFPDSIRHLSDALPVKDLIAAIHGVIDGNENISHTNTTKNNTTTNNNNANNTIKKSPPSASAPTKKPQGQAQQQNQVSKAVASAPSFKLKTQQEVLKGVPENEQLHPCVRCFKQNGRSNAIPCKYSFLNQLVCLNHVKGKCRGEEHCDHKGHGLLHSTPKKLKQMEAKNLKKAGAPDDLVKDIADIDVVSDMKVEDLIDKMHQLVITRLYPHKLQHQQQATTAPPQIVQPPPQQKRSNAASSSSTTPTAAPSASDKQKREDKECETIMTHEICSSSTFRLSPDDCISNNDGDKINDIRKVIKDLETKLKVEHTQRLSVTKERDEQKQQVEKSQGEVIKLKAELDTLKKSHQQELSRLETNFSTSTEEMKKMMKEIVSVAAASAAEKSAASATNAAGEEIRKLQSVLVSAEAKSKAVEDENSKLKHELEKNTFYRDHLSKKLEQAERILKDREASHEEELNLALHHARLRIQAIKEEGDASLQRELAHRDNLSKKKLEEVENDSKEREAFLKEELNHTQHALYLARGQIQSIKEDPLKQIASQVDAVHQYVKKRIANGNFTARVRPSLTHFFPHQQTTTTASSYHFYPNYCLRDNKNNTLLQLLASNPDVNFRQIIRTDPLTREEVLSPQFALAFHGTDPAAALGIMCKGFDPTLRRGQNYGPGEYFGEWSDRGFQTATSYDKGAMIVALIVKVGPVTRPNPNTSNNQVMLVVNNPVHKSTTFCIPICVAFTQGSALAPRCNCSQQNSAAASSSSSPYSQQQQQQQQQQLQAQYQDDQGNWQNMDPLSNSHLVSCLQRNHVLVGLKIGSHTYTFDLSNNTQTNNKTNKQRQIRFV